MTDSGSQTAAWLVNNMGPYRVNSLRSGLPAGHTAELGSNNLIVENIMMNDDRNGSNYRCVIVPAQGIITSANKKGVIQLSCMLLVSNNDICIVQLMYMYILRHKSGPGMRIGFMYV